MKTSELTGTALDWAVQMAEGYVQPDPIAFAKNIFKPSTDWAQGGSIIEREEICIDKVARENWCACVRSVKNSLWLYGPTPLIAAMRCYVASKLGETIEVPEELTI